MWLSSFIEDFFYDYAMIYTLMGSKPMSTQYIGTPDVEACIENIRSVACDFTPEEVERLVEQTRISCAEYTLHETWKQWVEWRKIHPTPNFCFRTEDINEPLLFLVHVINVSSARKVLTEHYDLFKAEIGASFDIESALNSFENPDSLFWKQVMGSDLLSGVLYGFGVEQSKAFQARLHEKGARSRGSTEGEDPNCELSLPAFRLYLDCDQSPLERFEEDRKKILKRIHEKGRIREALVQLQREIPDQKDCAPLLDRGLHRDENPLDKDLLFR